MKIWWGRFSRETLTAIAVLAVLLMPVSYRGGAVAAHPHAAVQLWLDEHGWHHHPDEHTHQTPSGAPSEPAAVRVDTDAPRWETPTPSLDLMSGLGALGLAIVIALLAPALPRLAWPAPLFGRMIGPDPPPPKAAR